MFIRSVHLASRWNHSLSRQSQRAALINLTSMNKIDLKGRKAVITGGARGIGYTIAERLLDSGASCSLWDRDPVRLAAAGKKLSPANRVHTAMVDITRPESAEAAAEAAFKHFGGMDILVNNAGIA